MIRSFELCWRSIHEKLTIDFYLNYIEIMLQPTWFSTKVFVGFFFWLNLHYKPKSILLLISLQKKTCPMEFHTYFNFPSKNFHWNIQRPRELEASPSWILFVSIDLSHHFTSLRCTLRITSSNLLRAHPNRTITKLGQKRKLFHTFINIFRFFNFSTTQMIAFFTSQMIVSFHVVTNFQRKEIDDTLEGIWWWWWWFVFVVWLNDERRLALFSAGTIVRDHHHRESPTPRGQVLNLRRTWVQALLNEVVQ